MRKRRFMVGDTEYRASDIAELQQLVEMETNMMIAVTPELMFEFWDGGELVDEVQVTEVLYGGLVK